MAKSEDDNCYPKRPTSDCKECKLYFQCSSVCIKTSGVRRGAEIMIFGEAPGRDEDELGRNHVGDAGRKLNYCLSRAKLRRKEVPIGNVVRCRPPGNKTPTKTNTTACWPYTLHDILTVRPKVIVAMGSTAMLTLAPQEKGGIREWAGFPSWRTFGFTNAKGTRLEHSCWVIPTFHTAAALRDWSKDALIIRDLLVAKKYAAGEVVYKKPDTKVKVLKTLSDVIAFLRRLRTMSGFVIDLETTSLDPHTGDILCIGFCYREGHATILPLRQQHNKPFWSAYDFEQVKAALLDLLEHATEEQPDIEVWGQHIKFDSKWLRKLLGLINLNVQDDTMVLHHLVDENKPHNLTFLCQWHLKWDKYDAMNYPYYQSGDFKAELVPNNTLWSYCGYDVDGTFQVRTILKKKIAAQGLEVPYEAERELINPLTDMEYRGVCVNVNELRRVAVEYGKKVEETQAKLRRYAGKYLSESKEEEYQQELKKWREAKQLWRGEEEAKVKKYEDDLASWDAMHEAQLAMWEEDGRQRGQKPKATGKPRKPREKKPPTKPELWTPEQFNPAASRAQAQLLSACGASLEKETATGLASTDAIVLAKLALKANAAGRVAQLIRDLRNYQNNKSKNLDGKPDENGQGGLVKHVSALGRAHTNYNLTNAVSGRLSSSEPNLQNVPRVGPFRGLFTADSEHHTFLAVDYEKIELCVLAWLSGDPVMCRELIEGIDLHTHMAVTVKLWRPPTDQEFREIGPTITKEQRVIAKGVNFGVPYGRSSYGIVESKDNQDAFPIDMPRDERIAMVDDVLEMFWKKYQGVARWRELWIRSLWKRGYVVTTDGRIRHMAPGLTWLSSTSAKSTWKYSHEKGDLERAAINFPIQGFANYILQRATRRVYNGIAQVKIPGLRTIMTIHDALNFSVLTKYVEDAEHYIPIWMNTVLRKDRQHRFEVPLKVEVLRQRHWGEEYQE